MKYVIKIRVPEDKDQKFWTAVGEGVVGVPYSYISGGIEVSLEFPDAPNRWIGEDYAAPLSMPRPAPKPSKKKRASKSTSTNDDE